MEEEEEEEEEEECQWWREGIPNEIRFRLFNVNCVSFLQLSNFSRP